MGQQPVRRVVTAQRQGRGVIASDAPAPFVDLGPGVRVFEVWRAPHADGAEPPGSDWQLGPPARGSVFRITEFGPAPPGEEPYMHLTPTIDFGVILEGELSLVMDGEETVLRAGDTFVQRQANHGWLNRSGQWCRMAVILIDGEQ